MLKEFRYQMLVKKQAEAEINKTVHLKDVDPALLGVPEVLLENFCLMVEQLCPKELDPYNVVTINQLIECFSTVFNQRANSWPSQGHFRSYIRNRLTIALTKAQLAHGIQASQS